MAKRRRKPITPSSQPGEAGTITDPAAPPASDAPPQNAGAGQDVVDENAEGSTINSRLQEAERDAARLRVHSENMRTQAVKCRDLQQDYETKKAAAKKAKEDLDDAMGVLAAMAFEMDQLNLFDDGSPPAASTGAATRATTAPAPDAWRTYTLGEAGFDPKWIKRFEEHEPPISTMGQLADFTKERRLTDVHGIGQATAEKIEAVLVEFWKAHPQTPAEPTKQEPAAMPASWRSAPLSSLVSQAVCDAMKSYAELADGEVLTVGFMAQRIAEFGSIEVRTQLMQGGVEEADAAEAVGKIDAMIAAEQPPVQP
jgi:hypothetical protein